MTNLELILSSAVFATSSVAVVCFAAYRYVLVIVVAQRHTIASAIETDGNNKELFRAAVEQRDALAAELQALKGDLEAYESNLAEVRQGIKKQLDNITDVQSRIRTAAQDVPLGRTVRREREERTSAEAEEPPGKSLCVTQESFCAEVEAAGLGVDFDGDYWKII